ncbi:MAG TPA: hypothetical protein VKC51_10165, partial [Lacunisphaera sp.]|nr:hypothetical protein [Lacunisphaera sp.]
MRLVARILAFTGCLSLLLTPGCYQVPVTGRSAISMVSDKEVAKMSLAAFEEMKKKYPVSRNKDFRERVQRVGEHLAKVVFW